MFINIVIQSLALSHGFNHGVGVKYIKVWILFDQLQEQYMFIHRAVRELLLCGDTTIKNVDLKSAVHQIKAKRQGEKETGFEKQFKVLRL